MPTKFNLRLEEDSAVPRYLQIKRALKEAILSGQFTERIPSEQELAKECKVAVMTLRRAVTELVEANLARDRELHPERYDHDDPI